VISAIMLAWRSKLVIYDPLTFLLLLSVLNIIGLLDVIWGLSD
jgi:hypothetical protein